MPSIEEVAIDTYNKNILYIKKTHPSLAQDLHNLDLAIEQNLYTQRYALEYINDNFDILDLQKETFLYKTQSEEFVKNTLQLINLDKTKGTIEGFSFFDVTKLNISNKDAIEDKKEVFELMTYSLNNISKTKMMKKIQKFIFFGTGLGLHISAIHSKFQPSDYLIVEDDLEIFKLSLFTTQYYEFAKTSRITFSILEDDSTFTQNIEQFLQNNFNYNRYIKYFQTHNHTDTKIRLFQTAISNQSFVTFPYNKQLNLSLRPLTYLESNYKFLNLSKPLKDDFFHDKPILVLAAGPSFEENIDWLLTNHSQYIIIAVSTVLKTLYKHNIKPDIVTHLDGVQETSIFYEGYDVKKYLRDSICIFSAITPKLIVDIFDKEQVYIYENTTDYHKNFAVPLTQCVGSFSYVLSTLLSSGKLYLLGLDLALNQRTGETHSSEHSENQIIDLISSDKINTKTSLVNATLKVEGNFDKSVLTNAILYSSVLTLKKVIPQTIQENQLVYNLSVGAKLPFANPLSPQDIKSSNPLNKRDLASSIKNALKESTTTVLTSYDRECLEAEYTALLNIEAYIGKFKKTHNKIDSQKYIGDIVNLFMKILEERNKKEDYNIVKIYYSYFRYVLAIIDDFFSTKGANNTKHHIKKINKIFEEGLDSIQDKYKNALKLFLEEESKN